MDVLADDMEDGRALALAQRLFPSFLVHVVAHRMCSWATLVGVGFVGPALREASTNGTHCQQQVVAAAVAMFEAERKTDWTDLSPAPFLYFPASSYGRPTASRAEARRRSSSSFKRTMLYSKIVDVPVRAESSDDAMTIAFLQFDWNTAAVASTDSSRKRLYALLFVDKAGEGQRVGRRMGDGCRREEGGR